MADISSILNSNQTLQGFPTPLTSGQWSSELSSPAPYRARSVTPSTWPVSHSQYQYSTDTYNLTPVKRGFNQVEGADAGNPHRAKKSAPLAPSPLVNWHSSQFQSPPQLPVPSQVVPPRRSKLHSIDQSSVVAQKYGLNADSTKELLRYEKALNQAKDPNLGSIMDHAKALQLGTCVLRLTDQVEELRKEVTILKSQLQVGWQVSDGVKETLAHLARLRMADPMFYQYKQLGFIISNLVIEDAAAHSFDKDNGAVIKKIRLAANKLASNAKENTRKDIDKAVLKRHSIRVFATAWQARAKIGLSADNKHTDNVFRKVAWMRNFFMRHYITDTSYADNATTSILDTSKKGAIGANKQGKEDWFWVNYEKECENWNKEYKGRDKDLERRLNDLITADNGIFQDATTSTFTDHAGVANAIPLGSNDPPPFDGDPGSETDDDAWESLMGA